jgi:hypothetical protein
LIVHKVVTGQSLAGDVARTLGTIFCARVFRVGAGNSARGGRAPLTSNASDWECDLDNRRGSGFTYFATQAAIYANAREKESDAVLY